MFGIKYNGEESYKCLSISAMFPGSQRKTDSSRLNDHASTKNSTIRVNT